MFQKVEVPILGVVENMAIHICSQCGHAEHIFGEGGGRRMAEQYGTPWLGSLPLTLAIREQTDAGQPTVVSDPGSEAAALYRGIARKLAASVAALPATWRASSLHRRATTDLTHALGSPGPSGRTLRNGGRSGGQASRNRGRPRRRDAGGVAGHHRGRGRDRPPGRRPGRRRDQPAAAARARRHAGRARHAGLFFPTVTLEAGTDIGGETWDIGIVSGKRTTVSSVDLGFTGRITRPEYAQRVQKLREDWRLKVGQPFINNDWNKAKAALLDEVSERDFLLARMTSSAAEIQAEQASAALSVTIDSGPQVNMGELKTEGLGACRKNWSNAMCATRWDRPTSRAGWTNGSRTCSPPRFPWRLRVAAAARRTGRARTDLRPRPRARAADALASAPAGDPSVSGGQPPPAAAYDSDGEVTLPVQVRVVEAPPKRLSVSMGVDDEAGARLESIYRQNVVFGQPLTLETGFSVDRLRQRAYADFLLPPTERGYKVPSACWPTAPTSRGWK